MSSTIMYCPVCGKNIKYYQKCPVCDYDKSRDYEVYPTLSYLLPNGNSVSIKRQEYENKRFEEKLQLFVYPKIEKLTKQIEELGGKVNQLESHLEKNQIDPIPGTELEKLRNTVSSMHNTMETTNSPLQNVFGVNDVKKGSIVCFGHYEQGDSTAPIEWRVLEIGENEILLVTENVIDCKPFNTERSNVTWETCTLRKWLNNEFLNSAFTLEERKWIVNDMVFQGHNPEYDTKIGGITRDSVFLLTISQAKFILFRDEDRMCLPTAYAKKQGAQGGGGTKCCKWWLRAPGLTACNAAYVRRNGSVSYSGDYVNSNNIGIRPAIRINFKH